MDKCYQDGQKQENKINRERINVTRTKVAGTNGAWTVWQFLPVKYDPENLLEKFGQNWDSVVSEILLTLDLCDVAGECSEFLSSVIVP